MPAAFHRSRTRPSQPPHPIDFPLERQSGCGHSSNHMIQDSYRYSPGRSQLLQIYIPVVDQYHSAVCCYQRGIALGIEVADISVTGPRRGDNAQNEAIVGMPRLVPGFPESRRMPLVQTRARVLQSTNILTPPHTNRAIRSYIQHRRSRAGKQSTSGPSRHRLYTFKAGRP